MIPLLGLLAGIVLGIVLEPSIPQILQPYLPIAIVAAMDALEQLVASRFGEEC